MSAFDPKRTLRSRFHTRVLSSPGVLASSRAVFASPRPLRLASFIAAGQRGLTVTTASPLTYIKRPPRLSSIYSVGLGASHADQVSSVRTFALAIATVVLLSAPVAMAQQRSAGVCVADIKAKCAGVEPGEGRIIACVKTHAAEFSEPCKARLARVAEITKACAADIKENCADKEKSRGKVRACIQKIIGNIKSDQCKEALAQAVAGKK